MTPELPVHGGRLNAAAERWGIPRHQWLDLSTGINPSGWPVPTIPSEVWQRLPEPDDGLESAIRTWTGAPAAAHCVPVPGSQAAIMALPGLRSPGRVGVPVPGYQEHGDWWRRAGHRVTGIPTELAVGEDERWLDELDVLVWISPNNPDGRTVPQSRLLQWHRRLQARGGWLVVDEAFVDGYDDLSLAPFTGTPGLVVLRSLGKFFGLAGIRAGAVLTDPRMARELATALGPWPLSGPTRYLMARAMEDTDWQSATARRLARDSEGLNQLLARHGLAGSSGTLLFRYLPHPSAANIVEGLARQGVLVRYFESPPALRFGLPGSDDEWLRLDQALARLSNVIDH